MAGGGKTPNLRPVPMRAAASCFVLAGISSDRGGNFRGGVFVMMGLVSAVWLPSSVESLLFVGVSVEMEVVTAGPAAAAAEGGGVVVVVVVVVRASVSLVWDEAGVVDAGRDAAWVGSFDSSSTSPPDAVVGVCHTRKSGRPTKALA